MSMTKDPITVTSFTPDSPIAEDMNLEDTYISTGFGVLSFPATSYTPDAIVGPTDGVYDVTTFNDWNEIFSNSTCVFGEGFD